MVERRLLQCSSLDVMKMWARVSAAWRKRGSSGMSIVLKINLGCFGGMFDMLFIGEVDVND